MAKITTKPIIAIIGSRNIKVVNFDLFLDKNNIAQIVSGGAIGIDTLGEQWAKRNRIDTVIFKPNFDIFGFPAALFERNKDIINYCDEVHAFWDGKSHGTLHALKYATKLNRPIHLHIIEERD